MRSKKPEMKPLFERRMKEILGDEKDFEEYNKIIHTSPRNFIRCNTIKIDSDELFQRLGEKWKVVRPFPGNKEIMLVDQDLMPGELGNAIEHLMGYYYIQEISSMMSVIALDPEPGDFVLDLCASPGSKTTQIAAKMENSGTLIANDVAIDRVKILNANLERCGVTNCIVTRNDGVALCNRIMKDGYFRFDKILLDAPCSGEGTLRSSAKTFLMWNINAVKNMGRMQKKLIANALKCLNVGGVLVYSTCTHAPEENEDVVNFALKNFPVEIERVTLPLKCRPGMKEWKDSRFDNEVEKCCRIYPHDNDSEGFFVCRMKLLKEIKE